MTAVGQALQTSAAAGFAAEDKLIAMLKRDGTAAVNTLIARIPALHYHCGTKWRGQDNVCP